MNSVAFLLLVTVSPASQAAVAPTLASHTACARLAKQLKSDPDEKQRAAAATALGGLHDDSECAVKALFGAVRDDDTYYVPYAALHALGALGPIAVSAVDDLMQVDRGAKPPLNPDLLRETLIKIGPSAIPRLIFHLRMSPPVANDPDQFTYEDKIGTCGLASSALKGIGKDVVPALISALSDPERSWGAALTLASMGPAAADAAPALMALYERQPSARVSILSALYGMGGTACAARDFLKKLLLSPEVQGFERQQVEGALANLRDCPTEPQRQTPP